MAKIAGLASVTALERLVNAHPDLDSALVADVLHACDNDCARAYHRLCDIVAPLSDTPDPDPRMHLAPPHATPVSHASHPHQPRPEYDGFFQSAPNHVPALQESPAPEPLCTSEPQPLPVSDDFPSPDGMPRAAPPPGLQGAWAHKSMGRKYRVDEICARYEWISRSVVEDLFNKYSDCLELVENDILQMFPVDEPVAFGGGQGLPDCRNGESSSGRIANGQGWNNIHMQDIQSPHDSRRKAMAESLRRQAANQIHRDSLTAEKISLSSKGMASLRSTLRETRVTRMQLQQLAIQTRKPAHIASAKEKDAELRRLSTFFIGRMRQSEEYKNGIIDLHGLTKEEALQLVEWKLQDNGRRRFKVITGKGIHSHNGQAVLRPALEKYFRNRGISCSMFADGIMSVVP